ncbi:MAG: tetratricopeptide repeat protein [Psychroserpens sp.]|nr:tetratricopeptide repeat protein [Psychroserpens sp.]
MRVLLIYFLLFPICVFAQQSATIDSLKYELTNQKTDTTVVRILNDLAYYYSYRDIDSSFIYARQAQKKAELIDDPFGKAQANKNIGNAFMFINQYDSAQYYFSAAKNICDEYDINKSAIYTSLGILYKNQGNYEKAIDTYFEGLSYDEETGNDYGRLIKLINLGNVYSTIGDRDKSLEFELKTLELAETTQDQNILEIKGILLNNIATTYLQRRELDKALEYLNQSLQTNIEYQNDKEIARNYNNLGILYQEKGDLKKALDFLRNALKIREQLKDEDEQVETNMSLGTLYAKRNNAQLSNVHFSKALEIANKIDNKSLISDVYLAKSNSYKEQNKFSEALADFESHVKYKDSVLSDNNQKNINEIEIKYETEKKEKALVAQELKLSKQEEAYQKKKVQNSIMTATAIVLLITSILLFLFFKQRQKRKTQEILTLKREHQVKTLEALIEGEENERFRIAKELHDGVNGDLSAIKYKLSSLLGMNNKVITEAIAMIDDSCKQVRAISHDLVPPSLENFNLVEATEIYCTNLNDTNTETEVEFQHLGDPIEVAKKVEINMFRIIQELVNNSIKHAKSSMINVQISNRKQHIQITVEDNGIGFNKDDVRTNGIGLKNVRSRVDYLNASMDLISNTNGTSYTIDIDIDQLNDN